MLLGVPDEDADLVEVEGEAGFVGGEDGEVLGDGGDGGAVVEDAGVGVVDVGEDVGTDDALAVGVAEEGVGCGDVDEAAVDPAGLVVGVADEPPVFERGGSGCAVVGGGRDGAGGYGFGDGGALEEAEGVAFGEEVEVVGFAAGGDVEVGFVGGGGGGDDGVVGAVFGEGVELVFDVLGDGEAFFDPADFAAGGADFEPAAGVFEDDELFAVGGLAGAVGDGGDAVAEEGLFGGDVDEVFFGLVLEVGAAGEGAGEGGTEEDHRNTTFRSGGEKILHEEAMPLEALRRMWADAAGRDEAPMFRVARMDGRGSAWVGTRGWW